MTAAAELETCPQLVPAKPVCEGINHAEQAVLVIEGEAYALAWLQRLRTGVAAPGELAAIMGFLTEEMLQGACRVIEKAVEGRA